MFSYPDTHRHRLGVNYKQIPVNCPYVSGVNHYQRDGTMAVNGNGVRSYRKSYAVVFVLNVRIQNDGPNYWPNSVPGAPAPVPAAAQQAYPISAAKAARYPQTHPNDDFAQARALFKKVMSEQERTNLIHNIVGNVSGATPAIQKRVVEYFSKCDPEYGRRVADGLRKASL